GAARRRIARAVDGARVLVVAVGGQGQAGHADAAPAGLAAVAERDVVAGAAVERRALAETALAHVGGARVPVVARRIGAVRAARLLHAIAVRRRRRSEERRGGQEG